MGSGGSRLAPNHADDGRAHPAIPIQKPFRVTINFFALLICVGYLLASAFYFYTRITYTLFTGDYAWYSIFILAVEFLGISALLPYAFMIVRTVLTNNTPGLQKGELSEGVATGAQQPWFTVHVLVPCYSESIDVISKTVEAALNAPVPPDCVKKVYVCDDGKKAVTQQFCQAKRNPNLIYVTGRSRKPGEKNGKSANLNNCLQNIIFSAFKNKSTGEIDREASKDIPLSDVVVVFDCDMICKANFFLKILEVMADDKLALCLTPQAFSNIDENIDLFNNINLQFWEYILPGSVAAGYIACTGTNFCIRARALAYVGWFPEYTITEDYALGMELACNGFKGSYLNEYLAVGEAPDEIRNVMRQRSRWTKGHMEVFFSKRCPILNWKLSCTNRYLYTNGTWAYFVTVITTPIFLLVPLISLVFGIHPVAVTREFALAAVIYFGFTFLLQLYARNIKHMKSLWFSNISNHVLCFTYFKAIFNTLMVIFGLKSGSGFKVTKKKEEKKSALQKALEAMAQRTRTMARSLSRTLSRRRDRDRDSEEVRGRGGPPLLPPTNPDPEPEEEEEAGCCSWWCGNAGDLENTLDSTALFVSFGISLAAMILGIYQAVQMGTFEVYTTLPIFWAGYNIVPPTLFLWYCFTKKSSFTMICNVMRIFGILCGIGAMVSLWFAPEAEVDASAAVRSSGMFLALNQAGQTEAGTESIASWVKPNGLMDGRDFGLDLSGGFYPDASSLVKYNHPLGIAVSMLAWSFVEFRSGIEKGEQVENYYAFFRHAGNYFSKLWLRSTNEYVTRVGDPEVDGTFMGVPPKDIDSLLAMQRPIYRVSKIDPNTGDVWGLDAISSGVAALASCSVALQGSPIAEDATLSMEYRTTAIDMWKNLVDFKQEIRGSTYCYDPIEDINICMATPKNISGCYIKWRNSTQVDKAPNPPPMYPPPTPLRKIPVGGRKLLSSYADLGHMAARKLLARQVLQAGGEGAAAGGEGVVAPGEGVVAPGEGAVAPGEGAVAPGEGPAVGAPAADPLAADPPAASIPAAEPAAEDPPAAARPAANPPAKAAAPDPQPLLAPGSVVIIAPKSDPPSPPWPPFPPSPPNSPAPPQPIECNSSLLFSDESYFNSTSVYDDAAWASSWLFRATETDPTLLPKDYSNAADYFLNKHMDTEAAWNNNSYYITNYNNMQWATALMQMQNLQYQGVAMGERKERKAFNLTQTYFRAWLGKLDGMKNVDGYELVIAGRTPGGMTFTPNASLPNVANTAMMAMQLSKMSTNKFTVKKLRCWARSQLRYMLGYPLRTDSNVKKMFSPVKGQSFVTGYGENAPTSVSDRAAACPESGATCGLSTWSSDDVNPNPVPGALVNGPDRETDKFINDRTSWTNHVGLLNNMGFNGLVAAFADSKTGITGPQCQEDRGLWDQLFNKVEFD